MKIIMVMFDSLNRRFLSPYGCQDTITPNFLRLAQRAVRFDNCYAGSLPCIPARRELHTGRYNFLHRSWGPLEPFDDSVPGILKENGIHSHLVSDHGHYWECGGATYHTQYSTWENIRGQEGDPWAAVVGGAQDKEPNFAPFTEGLRRELYSQNLANRTRFQRQEDYPLVQTFDKGIGFIEENADKDSWFLQIESFSPHEPFMAWEEFKNLYPGKEKGKKYEWPDYAPVKERAEEIDEVRYAYFAALSMCDWQLGRILDLMDERNLWKDTMLIVNTDHGYLLGEHGYWAKNYMPCYNEVAHIPLFIWDPRHPEEKNVSRKALVQTIDIPATILKFFGLELPGDMMGQDLERVISRDEKVRNFGIFGVFGAHICITDGRYVYMRAPENKDIPLFEYTLMPTHMMSFFTERELGTMERQEGFSFTKGLPVMKIQTDSKIRCIEEKDLFFDLEQDPFQEKPMAPGPVARLMCEEIRKIMAEADAPKELYKRFGFEHF